MQCISFIFYEDSSNHYGFLTSGVGLGPGIPGMQIGYGLGAGCGVGFGFGYGVGRGVAQDENKRYSNVGNLFRSSGDVPSQ